MAAPLSMKDRIAMFSADKTSEDIKPEKAPTTSDTATSARRSSIADQISALNAGGHNKTPSPSTSTPQEENNNSQTFLPEKVDVTNSTTCNETTSTEVKPTSSIADSIAAMTINSAEKSSAEAYTSQPAFNKPVSK